MSRSFLTGIDLNQNQLLNARVQQLASAPTSPAPVAGQIYYNTTDNNLYVYNGTAWKKLEENVAADWGEVGDITSSAPGDAAAAGSTGEFADAGHKHARESFEATPSTLAVGDSASAGSATTVTRGDHKHAMPSFGSVTSQTSYGASSGDGSGTSIARADHTHGTPAHGVSEHSSLKLSDFATPTADISLGSNKITNLATPSSSSDAATKGYVDGVASGLDFKASVRAASTANIDLTTGGALTVDGVSLIAGDRVLVKNQSTASQNGIYVVASGTWTRAADANTDAEVTSGMFTFVEEGTVNGNTGFVLTTDNPITVDTTSLTFAVFNAAPTYTWGNGLTETSNTVAVNTGTGITIVADAVAIDTTVVARKYSTAIGDGATSSYTVTHNLGTRDVVVQVYENGPSTYNQVECDVNHATTNTVTIGFATAPSTDAYRVIVTG